MKVNSLSKEWQAEQNDDVMKVITDYANKKIDDFNERRTGEVDEVGRNNLFRSYKNNILLAASRYIKSGGKDLSRLKNDVTDKIARNKTLENEFKLYALSKFNSLVDGKKYLKDFLLQANASIFHTIWIPLLKK